MLYAGGLVGAVLLLLWLFCIIDVIMTPESEIRHLPKLLWLLIVVALFEIGAVIWLIAGRPRSGSGGLLSGAVSGGGGARRSSSYPEYDRPGRFAATNPDDDDEFLAQVRERAEAQRRAESQRRREREEAERAERSEREQRRQARRDDEPGAP